MTASLGSISIPAAAPLPPVLPEPHVTEPHVTRQWLIGGAVILALAAATVVGISHAHATTATTGLGQQSVAGWVQGGGRKQVSDVRYKAYALASARNDIEAHYSCTELATVTNNALNYGPIPDAQTQTLWSTTLATAQNAVNSCSASIDANGPGGGWCGRVRRPQCPHRRAQSRSAPAPADRDHQLMSETLEPVRPDSRGR